MLKRLGLGLGEGLVIGAVIAVLVAKIGPAVNAAIGIYLGAIVVGAVTGLVAGRPIWAKAARLEALLKALVGAFVASVALFGIRKWAGGLHVDFGAFGAGPMGAVPVAVLPLLGAALALVFEIDDAVGPETVPERRHRVEDDRGLDAPLEPDESELEDDQEQPELRRRSPRER
jgi:hypothetical protein